MKKTIYLIVILQISFLAAMVLSLEAETEEPVTQKPDLEESFLNISASIKNISEKIAGIASLLPKASPKNSSESSESDQNNDLDVTNYNGTYDSIFEKVENIKNKVKELKNTLRSLSTTLDKGFDAEKFQKENNE
ncbi:uncharacterized protein [Rhodnius prolixus]|uniref:uncharacterized protein n=1 Tax=Rhodnius prolixus TaxID=13249 RepID=UPI003D18990E